MRRFSETAANEDRDDTAPVRKLRELDGPIVITSIAFVQSEYGPKVRLSVTIQATGERVITYTGDSRIRRQCELLASEPLGDGVLAQVYQGERNRYGQTFVWLGDPQSEPRAETDISGKYEAEKLARERGMTRGEWVALGQRHNLNYHAMVTELRGMSRSQPAGESQAVPGK